jgi:hypothetical protein
LNPLSNTIFAILIRIGCVYVLNRNMNTFYWNNSKLRNILQCVFLKTVIGKDWEYSFIEHDLKHVFLNSYIYWNGMFFLTIICIYFIETTQKYTIFWYMDCYQFVTFLTILKITAFLMIFWNVFIHSHGEWSERYRETQRNFGNRMIITIIQKIQYFSIHIWLKLLRA